MSGHCERCHYRLDVSEGVVCRRCARNFTRTETLHVLGLTVAYFVLCRFSSYLVSGNLFSGFWKGNLLGPYDLSGWGRFPVNLADYPLHLVTLGWLLALVIVLPALVGTLFGHKPGIMVAAVGGLFAGLPLLFLVTVPAAYLAGTRASGKLSVKSATWLAAALPLLYALALTVGTIVSFGVGFLAVWVLAAVVMVLHVELTLFLIGRRKLTGTFLVKLFIPEVLAILGIFYLTIGFDTVEYESVWSIASIRSGRFADLPGPDIRSSSSEDAAKLLLLRTECMLQLREQSLNEFQRFVELFPRSRFTGLAFYEMADLWNMKLYVRDVRPLATYIATDRVSSQSIPFYQRIIKDFNDSVEAAYARLKLADYCAQHDQVSQAARDYDEGVCQVYSTHIRPDFRPDEYPDLSGLALEISWRSGKPEPRDGLMRQAAYCHVMACARKRGDFIERNSDFNDIPFSLYLQADPRDEDFLDKIKIIPEWFPSALIVDNILWDRARRGGLKLDALLALYRAHPHGDVASAVLLELAGRSLKERTYDPAAARRYYDLLQNEFPDTPEAARARQELQDHFKGPVSGPSGN